MEMTPRERWLAALMLQPVDRLPFWPKVEGTYFPGQREPFRSMNRAQILKWMGTDNHPAVPAPFKTRYAGDKIKSRTVADGNTRVTIYETPWGTMQSVNCFKDETNAWYHSEYLIKTVADVKMLTEYYKEMTVEYDAKVAADSAAKVKAIGETALTASHIGRTPLMVFTQDICAVDTAQYLLADYPQEVEALFEAMAAPLMRQAEITIEHSTADLLYFIENTSTAFVSPEQFKTYCAPIFQTVGDAATAKGKKICLHMCGHIKAILPILADMPVAAFDAVTSPPVGNTTLLDARTACPRTCISGGTNAALWLEPEDVIRATIAKHLDELPHHRGIILTSAGQMPPGCPPEKIVSIAKWLREYPLRQ